MVDKLGLDGKKRRRRSPDESLTNEEILEYMGGVQPAEIMKKEGEKFTCQRCYEQVYFNLILYIIMFKHIYIMQFKFALVPLRILRLF